MIDKPHSSHHSVMKKTHINERRRLKTKSLIFCCTIFTVLFFLLFALFSLTFYILPGLGVRTSEIEPNTVEFFTPSLPPTTTGSSTGHLFGAGACAKGFHLKRTITYTNELYSSSDSCSLNVCTCQDGTAAVGAECPFKGYILCTECDSGFYLQSDTCTRIPRDQYLMYTNGMMGPSRTIYSYTLHLDRNPVKCGQFEIPYSASSPRITFNNQLNVLEVIGDNDDETPNKNHKMMTIAGSFSDAPDSLFNGDYSFEVTYSENVGTLVFSGRGHGGSCHVYRVDLQKCDEIGQK